MEYTRVQNVDIPRLGFGTFQLQPADARRMVASALQIGYRHIDTAQMYDNEQAVGQGIRDAGIDRSAFFLTTKVNLGHYHRGDLQQSVQDSLRKLDTDHVDLLLLHWPDPKVPLQETLGALMDAKRRGLTRHIGVSNFTRDLLQRAVAICGAGELLVNQIEYHVFLTQQTVKQAVQNAGMALTAYSPLARGKVLGEPVLQSIGVNHGKSEAQVAIRWLLDQDVVTIPKTTSEQRAEANFDVFDFQLSRDETDEIDTKLQGDARQIDPDFAPDWDRP